MAEFGCNGCDNTWGGYNTAHCGACHHTFTGVVAFDRHRVNGRCLHPEDVVDRKRNRVLTQANRSYSCWAIAGDKPDFWKE